MEFKNKKIEFDIEELMPLLIGESKQEGFKYIGEKILNTQDHAWRAEFIASLCQVWEVRDKAL